MNIELKKLKTHEDMSDETLCFSAEVWVDGQLVANTNNQGTGGENNYHVTPNMKPAWDKVLDHVKTQPARVYQGITIPYSIDQLIDDLITKQEERKQLKNWCKTQTVFRLKGDQPGSWRTIKDLFTPAVKEFMIKKYGNNIETIANEKELDMPTPYSLGDMMTLTSADSQVTLFAWIREVRVPPRTNSIKEEDLKR